MPSRDPSPPDADLPPSAEALVEKLVDCRWSMSLLSLLAASALSPAAILRSFPELSAKEMNERLREWTRSGIAHRTVVSHAPPIEVEYSLTPFGTRLLDALAARRSSGRPEE